MAGRARRAHPKATARSTYGLGLDVPAQGLLDLGRIDRPGLRLLLVVDKLAGVQIGSDDELGDELDEERLGQLGQELDHVPFAWAGSRLGRLGSRFRRTSRRNERPGDTSPPSATMSSASGTGSSSAGSRSLDEAHL